MMHLDSQASFLTSDSNLLQAQGKTEGDRSQHGRRHTTGQRARLRKAPSPTHMAFTK